MTRLLVVDTETGGLDPFQFPILSVALAVWEDGIVRDTFEMLVNEGGEPTLDPDSMAINQIDMALVRAMGLAPVDAVGALRAFIARHFPTDERVGLVGHNVGFDVAFLKRLFHLAGADFDAVFSHRLLDTASIIRFLNLAGVLPLESASLALAFEHFQIAPATGTRHTALGDVLATTALLTRLIEVARAGLGHTVGPTLAE